ncbi:MAG: pesticidal protein Cry28Aa, partial [Flavobacteriaceae bacterium]|nr:pesticidal protein Cry28Aa [Flavobacteriaceae bacterium]
MFFIKKSVFSTPKLINYLLWLLFLANLSWMFFEVPNIYGAIFKIDGFTILIYGLVTFFSALIANYSNNYLNGFKYQTKFALLCFGFTLSIMMFVTSNNILLLLVSWFLMGVFMSKVIGINSDWQEAKEASKFAFKYFAAGSFFLSLG